MSLASPALATIRPAFAAEEEAVAAIARSAYSQYIAAIGRPPAPMVADFKAHIAKGETHVHVAESGELDGYITFFADGDAMLLDAVAVLPSTVGQGIGRKLIDYCEAYARDRGFKQVRLYTNEKMTANLTLYPYLGYEEYDRRHQNGFDRVYYRKALG